MSDYVISNWHKFTKTKNINILNNILHKDIIFYSPALHNPKYGISVTKQYLKAAVEVLFQNNFKYISEIRGSNIASCEFEGYIEDIYINGLDLISWDKYNKMTSFKVFVRPLKGLVLLKDKMTEKLQQAN